MLASRFVRINGTCGSHLPGDGGGDGDRRSHGDSGFSTFRTQDAVAPLHSTVFTPHSFTYLSTKKRPCTVSTMNGSLRIIYSLGK
nr:MAG: hypothetical protein [Molluscum contagiosum virus]